MANFGVCPGCKKERQIVKSRGTFKAHNHWDGKKMVPCPGSGIPPGTGKPAAIIFRNA